MKTITRKYVVYTYNELSETAKQRVKEWYLNDPCMSNYFYDDIKTDLLQLFPNSDLDVTFSLCYRQGDGLNIYGTLDLLDFLNVDNITGDDVLRGFTDKEKRRLAFYVQYLPDYHFEKNNHYSYSCKFIDQKNIAYTLYGWERELDGLRDVDRPLLERFLRTIIWYFEKLDKEWEKAGYEYFYEVDEDELSDLCEANGWEFDEDGNMF